MSSNSTIRRRIPTSGARRPASLRELFVLIAVAQLMASMQVAMISVALPHVVRDLHTSLRWASWTISLFIMTQAVSLPLLGRLSDALGRRSVFVGGVALFGLSSLACALAPNIATLVVARGVQGIAAGSLLPSAYGIIGDACDDRQRTRTLGLISSILPIGAIVGPNIGGFLVEHYDWRATFLINVPIAIAVTPWALRRVPSAGRTAGTGKIDYPGAGLLTVAVGALMMALTELGKRDVPISASVLAIEGIVAVLAGVALVVRELHIPNPLVDLRLLRRREFASVNVLNFLYGTGIFGMISFVPLYAQEAYGFSASKAGLLLTPRAIAMVLMSILGGLLVNRTGFRLPIAFGLTATTISAGLLSLGQHVANSARLSDMLYLCLLVSLLGTGLGFAGPSANQAGLDLLPDQVAAVTGLRGMFRALGGAVATAAIGMISSRSATPGQGLEHSFALLAGLALLGLVVVGQIPDGPRRLALRRRKRGGRQSQRAGTGGADVVAGSLDDTGSRLRYPMCGSDTVDRTGR